MSSVDREAREPSINSFSLVLDHRQVRAFLSRNVHRMNFPCASAPTGRVAKAYNVSSTPKAYVILDNEVQWSGIADTSLELLYIRRVCMNQDTCVKKKDKFHNN